MADEPRDEERETFPDVYDDPAFPPEPAMGVEWNWDPATNQFTHPTGAVSEGDDGVLTEEPNEDLNLGPLTPDDEPPKDPHGIYVNRESGAMIRIVNHDESLVRYVAIDGSFRNSMRRDEYERDFLKVWRPATAEDLATAFG
jgi:hypothetical protein